MASKATPALVAPAHRVRAYECKRHSPVSHTAAKRNGPGQEYWLKHILRHAYELRDRVLRRIFVPTYVETAAQLADVLTKGLRPASHLRFLAALLPDCAR